jgi:hypothetical protein
VSFLRRRTFVINRQLQFGILLTSLGYVAFLVVVVSFALFTPLVLQLRHPDDHSAATSDAALQILYLHKTYWLPVALTLLAIALHSVATSHRIAGPVYRFRRVFEAMRAGVVPGPVKLRKSDYFRPEMDSVNAMLDAWRGLITQVQRDSAALGEAVSRYNALEPAVRSDGAAEALWEDIVRLEKQLHDTLTRLTCQEGAEGESRPAVPLT